MARYKYSIAKKKKTARGKPITQEIKAAGSARQRQTLKLIRFRLNSGDYSLEELLLRRATADREVAALRVVDIFALILSIDSQRAMRSALKLGLPPARRLGRLDRHQRQAIVDFLEEEQNSEGDRTETDTKYRKHANPASQQGSVAPSRPKSSVDEEWVSWWRVFQPPWEAAYLELSIDLLRTQLEYAPLETFEGSITRAVLAGCLIAEYQLSGDMDALTQANVLLEQVYRRQDAFQDRLSWKESDKLAVITAVNLATVNIAYFRRHSRLSYLEKARHVINGVVLKNASQSRPETLHLARSKSEIDRLMFEATGSGEDLSSSIRLARRVLNISNDAVDEANLASALLVRSRRAGRGTSDLRESIELFRSALSSTASDNPNYSRLQCNLGSALLRRGRLQDIEEAADLIRSALELTPLDSPIRHALELNAVNLAVVAAS